MSFFKDTLSILKKNELTFLKRSVESDHVYTFVFEKAPNLTWKAGQHGLFTITHKKMKDSTRPFSVASSPTEGVVQITTKISDTPSEFKKALLELDKGMKISMNGPVGAFYLKDQSHSLFIAGGIGITPFRAIVKQLEAEGNEADRYVKLLYLDNQKSYIFKEEFDKIVKDSSIDVTYLETRDELYPEIDQFIASHKNSANYFIAGSKSMVDAITNHLQSNQISKRNIKKDAFWGI